MSARSIATLQTGVDDVYVEVNALQTLLRSITDEVLKSSLLDDFKEGIQGKLDSLMAKLESITTRTAAQKADLDELGKRMEALRMGPELECRTRTMPPNALPGAARLGGGDTDATPIATCEFKFVSWNTQKRRACRSRFVLRDFRYRYGCDVVCDLQYLQLHLVMWVLSYLGIGWSGYLGSGLTSIGR